MLVASSARGRPRVTRFEAGFPWAEMGTSPVKLEDGWLVPFQSDRKDADGKPASEGILCGLGEPADRVEVPRFRLTLPARPPALPAAVPGGFVLVWDGKLLRFTHRELAGERGPDSGQVIGRLPDEHRRFPDPNFTYLPAALVATDRHLHLVSASPDDPVPVRDGVHHLPVRWLRFALDAPGEPPEDLSFRIPTPSDSLKEKVQALRGTTLLEGGRLLFATLGQASGLLHMLLLDLDQGRPIASRPVARDDKNPHLAEVEPTAFDRPDAIYAYLIPRGREQVIQVHELLEWRVPREALR
jgi:hypothetical protein